MDGVVDEANPNPNPNHNPNPNPNPNAEGGDMDGVVDEANPNPNPNPNPNLTLTQRGATRMTWWTRRSTAARWTASTNAVGAARPDPHSYGTRPPSLALCSHAKKSHPPEEVPSTIAMGYGLCRGMRDMPRDMGYAKRYGL